MRILAGVLVPLLLLPVPIQAQEQAIERAKLPRAIAARVLAFYRDSATTRLSGDTRIDAARAGNLAVLDGTLTIAAPVDGSVLVLNGDVAFEPGGSVSGDLTIVGGELRSGLDAPIDGTLIAYGGGEDDVAVSDDDDDDDDGWRRRGRRTDERDHRVHIGGADLKVDVRESYNRVEGLPLQVGPVIETNARNPLRIEATAVLRTEDGSTPQVERVGYAATIEQFLGGRRELGVGASVFSVVSPVESWQMSDAEASLATFLFHFDPRDHYERTGWGAHLRYEPGDLPLDLRVEYRDQEFATVGAGDPWTVFGDGWRLQPLVAEGDLRSLAARATVDLRDDDDEPTSGWYFDARVRRGVDGSLEVPPRYDETLALRAPLVFDAAFTTGMLDVRHYARVGTEGVLALRAIGGGSLTAEALAPQFQHTFGGPRALGGFAFREADCGARAETVRVQYGARTPSFHPTYGCDRFAVVQAEYRGGFDFGFDMLEISDHWDGDYDAGWTVFVEGGRGWAYDTALTERSSTETLADAGIGLFLGDLGLYVAVPVTGEDHDARFFARLGRRF